MVPRGLDQSEQDHSLHLATLPIGAVTLKAPKDELSWWLSGKESACQCKRQGFDPWSEKIPHAMEQLRLCATIIEPVL